MPRPQEAQSVRLWSKTSCRDSRKAREALEGRCPRKQDKPGSSRDGSPWQECGEGTLCSRQQRSKDSQGEEGQSPCPLQGASQHLTSSRGAPPPSSHPPNSSAHGDQAPTHGPWGILDPNCRGRHSETGPTAISRIPRTRKRPPGSAERIAEGFIFGLTRWAHLLIIGEAVSGAGRRALPCRAETSGQRAWQRGKAACHHGESLQGTRGRGGGWCGKGFGIFKEKLIPG